MLTQIFFLRFIKELYVVSEISEIFTEFLEKHVLIMLNIMDDEELDIKAKQPFLYQLERKIHRTSLMAKNYKGFSIPLKKNNYLSLQSVATVNQKETAELKYKTKRLTFPKKRIFISSSRVLRMYVKTRDVLIEKIIAKRKKENAKVNIHPKIEKKHRIIQRDTRIYQLPLTKLLYHTKKKRRIRD